MSETNRGQRGVGESRAGWVALGILLSRVFGLVREAVASATIGVTAVGDVFATAFRLPNLLQNLLGEQTLSASFIPVYSRLLSEGKEEQAGRFAGAIFGLLLAIAGVLTILGVAMAETLVAFFTPGYLQDAASVAIGERSVDRFPLAVAAVRIVFPMAGVLVLSAWTLGVLNSHRRLFLPYFAPVLWNVSIIAALLAGAGAFAGGERTVDGRSIVLWAAGGALAGGILQFAIQIPVVLRSMRGFRVSLSLRTEGVQRALRAFGPLLSARGAAQLSGYIDQFLASLLAVGAVAALRWGLILYMLPVSLFGLSVAAAELPELSRTGSGAAGSEIATRLRAGLRQIAYFVVPSSLGYLLFGFLVVGLVYRRGHFGIEDNWLTYLVLCGYAFGLVATTWSRLLANAFYSQGETKTPARIAVFRVVISALLGAALMVALDTYPVSLLSAEVEVSRLRLGAVGLAVASGMTSWLELVLLSRALRGLLPEAKLPVRAALQMFRHAVVAAVPALITWWLFEDLPLILEVPGVLLSFVAFYLALTHLFGCSELKAWLEAFRPRRTS